MGKAKVYRINRRRLIMPYIYKITNKVNGKIYIGKTLGSIEKRWKEHCNDYLKQRKEKRPLYSAMKKYGVENFYIEVVEECSEEVLAEREIYWIERYGSFKYGYNATIGGDGKRYCDYDLIYSLYQKGYTIKEIANKLNYNTDTCSNALKTFGITSVNIKEQASKSIQKTIIQKDKNTGEIINIFPSLKAACESLGKQSSGHISGVCNGKRKTAYGYIWEYGEK